jgi:hypothetical protein
LKTSAVNQQDALVTSNPLVPGFKFRRIAPRESHQLVPANDAPVSGIRVRKIVPRESHQFTSANDQLKSIVDAFRHVSADYNHVVFAIRKRTRQSLKKTRDHKKTREHEKTVIHKNPANTPQFSVRHFISRSASELPNRHLIGNADERHRRDAKQQSELSGLRKRELAYSKYLKTTPKTLYEAEQIDPEWHKRTLHNLGSIESRQLRRGAEVPVRDRTAIFRVKVDRSQANISEIEEDLRQALKHVDQLPAFTYAANHCAFDVYGLHVALRLRLGKMILYRQKRQLGSRRKKMAFGGLETRLLQLRAYDQVLFSKASVTSPQIRNRLTQLELQNQVQRSLVLRTQFGSQLCERQRLAKRRIHKAKDDIDPRHTTNTPAIRIRFRRNRERRTISEVHEEPRRVSSRHPIRFHDSKSELPARTAQVPEPKKSDRYKLWDTVSSWLEGGEIEIPDSTVEPARRPFGSRALADDDGETVTPDNAAEQTKRPFGSRALTGDERESVEKKDGLALLMESVKGEGRRGGRRR